MGHEYVLGLIAENIGVSMTEDEWAMVGMMAAAAYYLEHNPDDPRAEEAYEARVEDARLAVTAAIQRS